MKMDFLWLIILITFLCFSGLTTVAPAANSDNHTVTVQILAINEVSISGGNLTLIINSATAGQEPNDAVDNTSCDLAWTTNESGKKITVQRGLMAFPIRSTLKVVAQNITGGIAAPEVTVAWLAKDLVTGINATVGSCDLQYTASTTVSQGTGTDFYTITYTLTDAF